MIRSAWPFTHPTNTQFRLNRRSPQARGLVGWWPMLGDLGALTLNDHSGNSRSGTFPGGTNNPTWIQSQRGPVLSYDGGDYIDLGTHSAFHSLTDNFAISVWGWVSSFPSFRGLLSSKISGANTHWSLATDSPLLNFYLSDTSNIAVDANPPTSTWFHLLGTRINGTSYIYLNGVRQTATTTGAPNNGDSRAVVLGRWRADLDGLYWTGYLSDARIYNVGLTDAEVAHIYNPATRYDLYAPIPRYWPVGKAPASGAQTISPSLIASTETHYQPTITTGAVTVSPSLIASAETHYQPTVTTLTTISPSLIDSAETHYQPTITTGAVTISPSLIDSTATVYEPTVTSGLTIAPSRIDSTETHYQPTITTGAVTVSPSLIASGETHYQPTVNPGAVTVSPSLIASAETHYQPTVTQGAITISPDRIESTATFYQPVITTGAVTVSPSRIESTAIFYAPTVANVTTQTIDPSFLSGGAVVFLAIVSLYTVAQERIYRVSSEDRTFDIAAESRTYTVR